MMARMRLILLLLIAIVLPTGQVGAGASRVAQGAQQARELVPGVPIEREMKGGEAHAYRLTLAAGQYAHVVVDQRGIDVEVSIFGPDGRRLVQIHRLDRLSGPEPVSVVAETPGEYRLEVRGPGEEATPGRYEARIEELRVATLQDKTRVAAERAYAEGRRAPLTEARWGVERFEEALKLWRTVGDRWEEAETLHRIGSFYHLLDEPQKALEYLQQALPLRQVAGDQVGEAATLRVIGLASSFLGETQKGLNYMAQARRLMQAIGDHLGEAAALTNMSLTYIALGEYQKAIECLSQARMIYRALPSRGGQALTLLYTGRAYLSMGELHKALESEQESLLFFRAGGESHWLAGGLSHIARIYGLLGQHQKALEHFDEALRLHRKLGSRRGELFTLVYLGEFYSELGNHQKAIESYDQALRLSKAITDLEWEPAIHYGIARVERDLGHLTEARAQIEAALTTVESLRTKVASPELRASYLASVRDYYEFYTDLLMRLHERQPTERHDAAALQASERARARGLLDLLAEAKINVTQGIDPELKQREKATHAGISRIQSQLIQAHSTATPDKTRVAQLEDELKKVESEREQLETEIRQKHPQYADLQYPQPLGVKAIQALLDDQTVLLQYALGKERSFLFAVTRTRLHSYQLPPAKEISPLVHELRAALGRPSRRRSRYRDWSAYVGTARRLYQTLIAPAADVLAKKQNLVIVPDGVLYYLPFESLLSDEAKTGGRADYRLLSYLLKRWTVSYAPSASVLASLGKARRQEESHEPGKAFLAFADPVYEIGAKTSAFRPQPSDQKTKHKRQRTTDNGQRTNAVMETLRSVFEESGRWQLQRLTESRREVTDIAGLHQPGTVAVYIGAAAKEESLKSNESLSRARRIHLATHGIMSERQPQYSGLVLTLDDDPQEDGLLQVYEVFNLKLNAELVVLSACRTGLGKEVKGEGLVGLTRAFLYAGARSLVVSLSQVVDASTAELMATFYREMDRSGEKADALRQAKLKVIEGGRYAHPYYWSPFILVGEAK
jgi:CHAT domain-containing protein